ncbi:phospholipase A2 inhibitor and Ly6/PLAUR domain-containing protein-like [Vipera latastei]
MAAGLVVFFCLISSVLLTGVTSLKCQTCFAVNGECKNEDMTLVECEPDQTRCLSLTFCHTLSDPPLSYTAKSCAKAEQCLDGFYSITSAQGKYSQLNIQCCQSDGCNALPLLLPLRKELRTNGLICPGSYTKREDSPQPTEPVLCLEQESQCINLNFTMDTFGAIRAEGNFQGCTTPNVCSFPGGEVKLANGLAVINTLSRECNSLLLSFDKAVFDL